MDINNFPPAPSFNSGNRLESYSSNGKPTNAVYFNNQEKPANLLGGVDLSGFINTNVTIPMVSPAPQPIIPASKTKSKKKKKKIKHDGDTEIIELSDEDIDVKVSSKDIVESTVYSDTYQDTNSMTYDIINQADQLLGECKRDLDTIRNQRTLKGKYHYINDTVTTMSSLLSTKLTAIKEINSTIKNVNDNEYRRFKDMRALDTADDNKAIMDAYQAFISAPVGAPQYNLPGTAALTGGLNGIIRADYPSDVQAGMDAGMANYLSNLSPEENLMLHDVNKNIEEVIVYDQATGAKRFQWMNTSTGEMINNMPPSSNLTIDDYTIDTRTGLAKNNNLNSVKKVVIRNGSSFDNF